MKNDVLGCCTISAIGHTIQGWTLNASTEQTISDDTIVQLYSGACGYVVGDPSTDQGGDEQTVLRYWQNNPVKGHKLDAWASVDKSNMTEVQQSIWLTGGVYVAINLPLTAQHQDVWDYLDDAKKPWWKVWAVNPNDPGSWGGHAVRVLGYRDNGNMVLITWGKVMEMTPKFWEMYGEECYALLSKDWIGRNSEAPSGFTYQILAADMPSL